MVYASAAVCDKVYEMLWPWDDDYLKLDTPLRMLVKAGALIAAEIDRRIATEREGSL